MTGATTQPLVSIIIPLHDCERFIGAAIESCLTQSWPEREVVVVDDESCDDGPSVVEHFGSRGVRLVRQARAGAAAARNRGLREASGAFIQYLDADDMLAPEKIAIQMQALQAQPEGYVASCGWAKFVGDVHTARFEPQRVWGDFTPVDWLITAWEGGGMMQTACWLTPRAVAERAGAWDETLCDNPADDGEYFCRVLLASRGVRFCPDAKVYYRKPAAGHLSRSLSNAAVHSLFMNCERYREHILSVEDSPRVRRALCRNYSLFVYRFGAAHSDLAQCALNRMRDLGCGPRPGVGGVCFRLLSQLLGFELAVRLRFVLAGMKP